MKKLFLLLGLATQVGLFAQSADKLSQWYWEERFLVADKNEDALLEIDEMQAMPNEFRFYFESSTFHAVDANSDGFLSFREMSGFRTSEANFRINFERKQIRAWERSVADFSGADAAFFKQNPSLAAKVLANYTWMLSNSAVVEALCADKEWMNAHSEVLAALNANFCWMAANPTLAQKIYTDYKPKYQSPEMLSWRSSHLKFIRQNPAMKGIYEPEGFQVLRVK